jgi:hypothetical protein
MKTLSIRQPWAWLIVHGGKDIENRTWLTKFRGRFLVHASQGMTKEEYTSCAEFAQSLGVTVPSADQLLRGGIIGSVEVTDSVHTHPSAWYMGDKAMVLRAPRPLPFMPLKGRLGFFEAPGELIAPHLKSI